MRRTALDFCLWHWTKSQV